MPSVTRFRPKGMDNRFRENRFRLFRRVIGEVLERQARCHILDIGGEPEYWQRYGSNLDWTRIFVSVVNITASSIDTPGIEVLVGDARHLDQYPDLSFDVVHSNSVIEHVGRWTEMASMANEVRRLAPRYFVQTPYFWFPIEPHARTPLLHWLPESWKYRIVMYRKCGFWSKCISVEHAMQTIQSSNLLDKRQMRFLFPDGKIIVEKAFGLPKSLIAMR